MRSLLIAVMLASSTLVQAPTSARAQTSGGLPAKAVVDGIRKDYRALKKRMADSDARAARKQPAPGIVLTELVVNRNNAPWRAVGTYRLVYRFWHEEDRAAGHRSPKRLRFVEVETRASASKIRQEFMFNARGRLVFHFRHADAPGAGPELRVYYAAGRPIRVVRGRKVTDLPKGPQFDLARRAQAKADALTKVFQRMLRLPAE